MVKDKVKIEHLGRGTLLHKVTIGKLKLFFSYDELVAFKFRNEFYCSKNEWSKTTAKHLNQIEPDHKQRIEHSAMLTLLEDIMFEVDLISPY